MPGFVCGIYTEIVKFLGASAPPRTNARTAIGTWKTQSLILRATWAPATSIEVMREIFIGQSIGNAQDVVLFLVLRMAIDVKE